MSCLNFKINLNYEKQIISLITSNEEKEGWHYLAVKKHLHHYMEQLQNIRMTFIA